MELWGRKDDEDNKDDKDNDAGAREGHVFLLILMHIKNRIPQGVPLKRGQTVSIRTQEEGNIMDPELVKPPKSHKQNRHIYSCTNHTYTFVHLRRTTDLCLLGFIAPISSQLDGPAVVARPTFWLLC